MTCAAVCPDGCGSPANRQRCPGQDCRPRCAVQWLSWVVHARRKPAWQRGVRKIKGEAGFRAVTCPNILSSEVELPSGDPSSCLESSPWQRHLLLPLSSPGHSQAERSESPGAPFYSLFLLPSRLPLHRCQTEELLLKCKIPVLGSAPPSRASTGGSLQCSNARSTSCSPAGALTCKKGFAAGPRLRLLTVSHHWALHVRATSTALEPRLMLYAVALDWTAAWLEGAFGVRVVRVW